MEGRCDTVGALLPRWNGPSADSEQHTPRQVYSAGPDEVMLYGEVGYGLENGAAVSVPFAARLSFTGDKLGLYQVRRSRSASAADRW